MGTRLSPASAALSPPLQEVGEHFSFALHCDFASAHKLVVTLQQPEHVLRHLRVKGLFKALRHLFQIPQVYRCVCVCVCVWEKKRVICCVLSRMSQKCFHVWAYVCVSYLYFARKSCGVHSACHINRVSPDVILRTPCPNHPGNDWPHINPWMHGYIHQWIIQPTHLVVQSPSLHTVLATNSSLLETSI